MDAQDWAAIAGIVLTVLLPTAALSVNSLIRLRLVEVRLEAVEKNADAERIATENLRQELHSLVVELKQFVAVANATR